MSKFSVLYDACVLYPAPLRDLLMRLALTDLFSAKWTNQIHEEWISNLLKNRPDLNRASLERTKNLMNLNARDCLVEGYEHLIELVKLPDTNDRHVLAAAIHAHCDAIITYNLKDFPEAALSPYNIEVIHPDDFIKLQIELSHQSVILAVKEHRESLKNPPKTVDDYLETLLKQHLPQTVDYLQKCKDFI